MKTKPDPGAFFALIKKIIPPSFFSGPACVAALSLVFCVIVIVGNMHSVKGDMGAPEDFETGKVADRDVIAHQAVTYEDEKATRLRREAQESQVPAVFRYSSKDSDAVRGKWKRFLSAARAHLDGGGSGEGFVSAIRTEFPSSFSADVLDAFYRAGDREELLLNGSALLEAVLEKGIFAIPPAGLERLNPDLAELIRDSNGRVERERVRYDAVITRDKVPEALDRIIDAGNYSPSFAALAPRLLAPLISENVFYSPDETVRNVLETREKIEPVLKYIEKGKRVVRKGFLITEEDMIGLHALNMSLPGNDIRNIISRIMLLVLLFSLLVFYCANNYIGRALRDSEAYLVCALSVFYIAGVVLVRTLSLGETVPVSLVVPTALVVMLPSILVNPRLALLLAMALPLGAFFTGSFDSYAYLFALVSGVVASFVLRGSEKRMDLVKAGLVIAAANCAAITAILLAQRAPAGAYPGALFWSAFNGAASGMLVLGFLPPLEHALNAATSFRLIELSDLNAPVLRRLFTAAPGTYSHSIMVANLAEAACQDIGANALLARVGAYYHDIGKMETPEYFVENQTDYNKHDDMAPRLSATVIRSHVKLGLEKARQLGLPREVSDIIVEHHGNSVITWFYNKALKQEKGDSKKGAVNMEDFSYPGTPPRSRESAVVMLADVTEAAVRTLDRPNAAKLEKFIQELFNAKAEHGQLARAELTFRDLETIKNAFVRVLAGYYHSRIEYPKMGKDSSPAKDEAQEGQK
ncbi:MAG: HDIG domain-containing protein [Treponema sp.]|jgi:putative nucleotidyltransferase with HDIG domain|nr:HDIG domain-containing protein [Treponema sp.]